MKIRIAKKKLKKVISEAYRINKRRVKLSRTYFAFRSGYGYRYRVCRQRSNTFVRWLHVHCLP